MLFRSAQELADLVRDGRGRTGWSQTELAQRVGVSRQWVSLVENGKTSVEFDLVLGVLQTLGYRLRVEFSDVPGPGAGWGTDHRVSLPGHPTSPRTRLTSQGERLGTQRTRRRQRGPGQTEDRRE